MAILAQLVDDVVVSKFNLNEGQFKIGRHPDNDIMIDDISVSGYHAVIEVEASKYLEGAMEFFIVDNGSKNGTNVNDKAIHQRERLVNGDVVRIAWNQFKLIDESSNDLASTAHVLQ